MLKAYEHLPFYTYIKLLIINYIVLSWNTCGYGDALAYFTNMTSQQKENQHKHNTSILFIHKHRLNLI